MNYIKGTGNSENLLSHFAQSSVIEDSDDYGFVNYSCSDSKLNFKFKYIYRKSMSGLILKKIKQTIRNKKINT